MARTAFALSMGLAMVTGCAGQPAKPPEPAPVAELSCLVEVGATASAALVKQCIQVSPATHPPCNAQNSCAIISGEIKRGCDFIGEGKPDFCGS